MKLAVCLLAVTWCVLANAAKNPRSMKLQEIMVRLIKFKTSMQQNTLTLHTPSLDIQECCTLSALDCFRTQMFNITGCDKTQKLLDKNLRDPLTLKAVNSACTRQEKTGNAPLECDRCVTFPKRDTKDFMQQLELLLQKAFSGL